MSGIVVLISGRGSNLAALCNAGLAKQIKCVISNKADALGLEIAKQFNIPSHVIEHQQYPTREDFDRQVAQVIDKYNPHYIILAGFMRILSSWLVNYYSMRLINIHPSLLPAFTGSNAISQTFSAKVKISGVTIHFVTEQLDHGPILAQGIVATGSCNTIEELASRIHQLEHIIYPFIIHKLIDGSVEYNSGQVTVKKDSNDINILGEFRNNIFY